MVQKKVCGFGKLPPPRETLWITLPPYRYCCSIALLVLDPMDLQILLGAFADTEYFAR